MASRVLEVIEREDVPARARERGAALRRALEAVRAEFPDVIRSVRGRGLLLGVELDGASVADSFILRALVARELFGLVAASWLLDRHQLRLLPTLSAPTTLRVEPSVWIDDEFIARLREGLSSFCRAVRAREVDALLEHLVEDEQAIDSATTSARDVREMPHHVQAAAPHATRVAFLNHFVYPERELAALEPSLGKLSVTARRALLRTMVPLLDLEPVVASSQNMLGDRVHFTSIGVPVDVATLQELHRMGHRRLVIERIQEAVELAKSMGCSVVALGAYTSIVTQDGTALMPPPGVRLTSGNTFTVAVGARRVLGASRELGFEPASGRETLAIVGATGNIGAGLTHRLLGAADGFRRALLVGRNPARLEALRREVRAQRPSAQIELATEMTALREAQVVVIATNAAEPLIFPHHLAPGQQVLIVDISVPSAVSAEARALPAVKVVPLSGTVAVPGEPRLVISSHTLPGTAFACAAEAMLLGLEPEATSGLPLVGRVEPEAVRTLDEVGVRQGFFERLEEGGFRTGG